MLFSTINLFAHPHIFIDIHPTIEVKNGKIIKMHFKLVLDEITSSMLIMEFDKNNNRKIDKDENKYAYDNYFITLQDYDFYTDIKVNGKSQKFPKPINFKTTIENNKICYSFDITQSYDAKNTQFNFGDTDFYVAMILKKEFVKVKGSKFYVKDLDGDFYFGYILEFNHPIKNKL